MSESGARRAYYTFLLYSSTPISRMSSRQQPSTLSLCLLCWSPLGKNLEQKNCRASCVRHVARSSELWTFARLTETSFHSSWAVGSSSRVAWIHTSADASEREKLEPTGTRGNYVSPDGNFQICSVCLSNSLVVQRCPMCLLCWFVLTRLRLLSMFLQQVFQHPRQADRLFRPQVAAIETAVSETDIFTSSTCFSTSSLWSTWRC